MTIPRAFSIGAAILGVAAGTVLAISPTAGADVNNSFQCEPGGLKANCFLFGTASQEVWTLNGNHYLPGDGRAQIFASCGAQGALYRVSVTFLDGTGAQDSRSETATCQRVYQ